MCSTYRYKGVSRVSIKSEHVKDLTIKMATSIIVICHRSDNAYIDEVHLEKHPSVASFSGSSYFSRLRYRGVT